MQIVTPQATPEPVPPITDVLGTLIFQLRGFNGTSTLIVLFMIILVGIIAIIYWYYQQSQRPPMAGRRRRFYR